MMHIQKKKLKTETTSETTAIHRQQYEKKKSPLSQQYNNKNKKECQLKIGYYFALFFCHFANVLSITHIFQCLMESFIRFHSFSINVFPQITY